MPTIDPGVAKGIHYALASVTLLLMLIGLRKLANPRHRAVVFFSLPPTICFLVAFDNIVLAADGAATRGAIDAARTFNAAIVPLCLVTCWEVGYQIHKRRSVNFCCIAFDASHRRGRALGAASFLRFSVAALAVALFVLGVCVNHNLGFEASAAAVASVGKRGVYDYTVNSDETHFALSLVPAAALVLFGIVIGSQLWNYGTYFSLFKTHATYFNPWNWMTVGTLALLAGHAMQGGIYAVTANAGEVAFLLCLQRMFPEIEGELAMQDDFFTNVIRTQESRAAAKRDSETGMVAVKQGGHGSGGRQSFDAQPRQQQPQPQPQPQQQQGGQQQWSDATVQQQQQQQQQPVAAAAGASGRHAGGKAGGSGHVVDTQGIALGVVVNKGNAKRGV